MEKTLYEQTGGTYTMQGDYCLPNLTLPPEEERHIGVWAHRRRQYLKQHHKILYYNLLNIPPQTGQQNGGNRSRVTVEMSPGVRLQVQAVE